MNFKIQQDGETVGTVTTEPVNISGDVPESVTAAVEAEATVPNRNAAENVVSEQWTEPTAAEIQRRLIATAARRDFEVVTDASA